MTYTCPSRWIVCFSRGEGTTREAFTVKFNNLDNMLLSISRAKSAGYKAKVFPAKKGET